MSQRHLIDVREIEDVLISYATAIDQRDGDLFKTCFTDDVVADYEGIPRWKGVGTLTDFIREAHDGLGSTLHRLTNMASTVIDDGWRIRARTFTAVRLGAAGGGR
jgi:hypothetical protein